MINKFGDLGGFDRVLARLTTSDTKLTVALVIALLKPWGLCYEYLTQSTIKKYFAPIIVRRIAKGRKGWAGFFSLGICPTISRSID